MNITTLLNKAKEKGYTSYFKDWFADEEVYIELYLLQLWLRENYEIYIMINPANSYSIYNRRKEHGERWITHLEKSKTWNEALIEGLSIAIEGI